MENTKQHAERCGSFGLRNPAATVLMFLAVFLLAGCGGGNEESGAADNGSGSKNGQAGAGDDKGGGNKMQGGTTGAEAAVVTDPRVVFVTMDPKTLNGDRARFKDMEVRNVVSERAFFVGENDAEQLLVLNVGDGVEVSEGQKVLVAGRLNTPRPQLEEKLSLSPEEAAAVNDQQVFLRAPRVTPQEG